MNCNEQEQRDAEEEQFDPWEQDAYFGAYASLELQKSMIQDKRRNEAFKKAIESTVGSKVVFKD
jgi:hypothetical protein